MSINLFDVGSLIHTAAIANSEEFTNTEKSKQYWCSEGNCEPYFERLQGILMEMEHLDEQDLARILADIPKCKLVIRNLNILGEYFADKRSIKYYRQTPETLEIVKIHERFHAMHHLYQTKSGFRNQVVLRI